MQKLQPLLRAFALAACVAFSGEASAQLKAEPKPNANMTPKPGASPVGRWQFQTHKILNNACTMSGEMAVWRTKTGAYSCRFVAFQICTSGLIKHIRTRQSCSVSDKDGKLFIESKVENIEKVEPIEITEMVQSNYAADNFLVVLDPSGDEMRGMFISMSEAPVRFVRLEERVS